MSVSSLPVPEIAPVGSGPGEDLRVALRLRDGVGCHYCSRIGTTLDHVVSEYRGGPTVLANLVLACAPCNSKKGHRPTSCGCAFCLDAVFSFPETDPRPRPPRPRRYFPPLANPPAPAPLRKTRIRKTGPRTWSVTHAEGYTVPCPTWAAALDEAVAGIGYTIRSSPDRGIPRS